MHVRLVTVFCFLFAVASLLVSLSTCHGGGMTGADRFSCAHCGVPTKCTKRLTISKLPQVRSPGRRQPPCAMPSEQHRHTYNMTHTRVVAGTGGAAQALQAGTSKKEERKHTRTRARSPRPLAAVTVLRLNLPARATLAAERSAQGPPLARYPRPLVLDSRPFLLALESTVLHLVPTSLA